MTDALSRRQERVLSKIDRQPSLATDRDVTVIADMLDPAESASVHESALDAIDTLWTVGGAPGHELLTPLEQFAAAVIDPSVATQPRHRRALELRGRLACQHATADGEIQAFYRGILEENHPISVRRTAVTALGTVTTTRLAADSDSVETLITQLEADDPKVAAPAAIALGGALQRLVGQSSDDYQSTVERLVDGLFDTDPWVRVGCLRAL